LNVLAAPVTATDALVPPPRPLVTQDDFEDHDPATIQRFGAADR
jgi:hypothetical protein